MKALDVKKQRRRPDLAPATEIHSRLTAAQRAFYEGVYEQYKGDVKRFLQRQGLQADVASDLLHDVYYRIIRQNEPDKLSEKPRAYLYTIAINLVRDRARRRKATPVIYDSHNEHDSEMYVVELSPEKQVLVSQQLNLIKEAILDLPERSRQILVLHRFEHMNSKEISVMIGVPLRSVQRHLNEALAFCQRYLDRENNEGVGR